MNKGNREEKKNPIEQIAAFIVDKRKAFYLLYIGLFIFCIFSSGWVKVNEELTDYLPADTETRRGFTIMEEEFTTFGANRIMVDNISYEQAEKLADELEQLEGVESVSFDNSSESYVNGAALFSITYEGTAKDEISLKAFEQVKGVLDGYDIYITGETGNSMADSLNAEIQEVMVVVVIIIILVLLFTSKAYMEIPVLLMTFGMAALLNMGTNYMLGEISFVSNSVAVVLQLALAIDYAIILCHRYSEEREKMAPREAVIIALSKAIPEISGSSLTTLSGLAAMCFMRFRIGYDLGIVLIKAIILSLVSVFTLMPGLLLSFSRLIDKTKHKNFVPKITGWGRMTVKTRYIMPPIFIVLLIAGFIFSNRCPYVYGVTELSTFAKNEAQIAQEKVDETFGRVNTLAVVVPSGDYEKEGLLLAELEAMPEVDSVRGLSNIEAVDGYVLTDMLTPRQFAELIDLDVEEARLLYSAYAMEKENYGRIVGGIDNYSIPLIDLFGFIYDVMDEGYIRMDDDMAADIKDLNEQLDNAKLQLAGEHYSRIVLQLNLPEESPETFDFLDKLHQTINKYYEGGLLVGNSTSDRDLSDFFVADNTLLAILTIVFVILVLMFTFKSSGLPVLLIMVIQGSVWINFSFPYLMKENLFFLSYLVVSSIQMGANIDYAIVIANRYTELKKTMRPKDAVVEALNQAFPTIITSGVILATAGILIGFLSSNPTISSIGVCLGRGTLISIVLVLGILPQILLLGDAIIEKTAFTIKGRLPVHNQTGSMRVDGHVRGYISGMIDGNFSGSVQGTINAVVESGDIESQNVSKPQETQISQEKIGGNSI